MKSGDLNPEWQFQVNQIRSIADQMVKARWLKAYVVSNQGVAYQWTKYGLTKIKQLSDMWDELTPKAFDPEYGSMFWATILRAAVEHGIRKSTD